MRHEHYMQQALIAAAKYKGFTEPNPAVGAVLVLAGEIISVGAHQQAGLPHAEVVALPDMTDVNSAVLYVTLEPCCHHGKTPPCTDFIIATGIKQVYFSFYDPNPKVAGNGRARLEQAGVKCEHLPLQQVDVFYREYAHWVQTKTPWVTAKIAITPDGFIAAEGGVPLAITGERAHTYTHHRRKQSSAVLTSVQTIINDNPAFNVRMDGEVIKKPLLVLDSKGRMPPSSSVIESTGPIYRLHAADLPAESISTLHAVTNIPVDFITEGLCLSSVLRAAAELGMHHLWLEVGAELLVSLLKQDLINELVVYVGPKVIGLEDGIRLPKLLPANGGGALVDSWQDGDDWVAIWLL